MGFCKKCKRGCLHTLNCTRGHGLCTTCLDTTFTKALSRDMANSPPCPVAMCFGHVSLFDLYSSKNFGPRVFHQWNAKYNAHKSQRPDLNKNDTGTLDVPEKRGRKGTDDTRLTHDQSGNQRTKLLKLCVGCSREKFPFTRCKTLHPMCKPCVWGEMLRSGPAESFACPKPGCQETIMKEQFKGKNLCKRRQKKKQKLQATPDEDVRTEHPRMARDAEFFTSGESRETAGAEIQLMPSLSLDNPEWTSGTGQEELASGTRGYSKPACSTPSYSDIMDLAREVAKVECLYCCPSCGSYEQTVGEDGLVICERVKCGWIYCPHCMNSMASTPDCDIVIRHSGCGLLRYRGSRCLEDGRLFPDHWDGFRLVEYSRNMGFMKVHLLNESKEYLEVSSFIKRSSTINIKNILRIQNPGSWRDFVMKRKKMRAELGYEDLNERVLFHGTSQESLNQICQHGFSCLEQEEPGETLAGCVFSARACKAEIDSCLNSSKNILVCYVTLGRSLFGKENEHHLANTAGRTNDSWANQRENQHKFRVACLSQAYPAYSVVFV